MKRNIYFIKLNYGGKYFENVSVKTDYYVLKNSNEANYNTIVEYVVNNETVHSNVILSKTLKFIPNIFNEHINSIFNKINLYGKQYECIISSDCHKTRSHVKKCKNDIFKYPLFNTSGNPYEYFSSKPHKNQYSKKVILSNSGKISPFYDDGKLGTTQDSMYILVNSSKEGYIIINTIKSKLYTFLIKICQWGNFRNEAQLFTYLKYPTKNKINYFNLTETEMKIIDSSMLKSNNIFVKLKEINKNKIININKLKELNNASTIHTFNKESYDKLINYKNMIQYL